MSFNGGSFNDGAAPQPPAPQSATAPGWYPIGPDAQRYWDGEQWTDNVAPLNSGAMKQSDQNTYALGMHLGGVLLSFIVPLIMWLIKKDDSEFIDFHGRQALNLQITMVIAVVVSFPLIFVGIGIIMLPIAIVLFYVFGIIAAIKASNGEYYRIPIALKIL